VSPDGKTLATAGVKATVHLWELATGKERGRIALGGEGRIEGIAFAPGGQAVAISGGRTIHLCGIATGKELGRLKAPSSQSCLRFSRDGKWLASAGGDTAILLWDVSRLDGECPAPRRLTPDEIERLRKDLEGEDARKAFVALHALSAAPEQAVALLRKRLRPVAPVADREIADRVADLGGDAFETREDAVLRLQELQELAEPALRKALRAKPDPEVRRRAEKLLARLGPHPVPAAERWELRAVELLERIATRQAVLHLEAIAKGAPAARLTLDAKAALERLTRRPPR
jgi:hypothetical protein